MKKVEIFLCVGIFFFFGNCALATSKVTGYIQARDTSIEKIQPENAKPEKVEIKQTRSSHPLPYSGANKNIPDDVVVLGISEYADGALLRSSDKKIYIIENGMRRRILNLKELEMYRGRRIFDVDNQSLFKYLEISFGDGDLIRGSDMRIFVVHKNAKKHILNLDELRKGYMGRRIFDVGDEVIRKLEVRS